MKNVMKLVLKEDLIWEQTPEGSLWKARLVQETITVLNKWTRTTFEQQSVEVFCAEPPRCRFKKKSLEPRNSGRNRSIFVYISAIVGCHYSPWFRGDSQTQPRQNPQCPICPFSRGKPSPTLNRPNFGLLKCNCGSGIFASQPRQSLRKADSPFSICAGLSCVCLEAPTSLLTGSPSDLEIGKNRPRYLSHGISII